MIRLPIQKYLIDLRVKLDKFFQGIFVPFAHLLQFIS